MNRRQLQAVSEQARRRTVELGEAGDGSAVGELIELCRHTGPTVRRQGKHMRTIINLNGTWDFVADLDPKYHAIHGGFHKPEANRRHWLKVPVPGVWQKYGERYDIFEGVCWFAREFEAPDLPAGATARLRFGAVNYLANVYVNGRLVGSHEGGYTEFTLDITGKVKPGRNHLAVQVDNRATTIKWPPCLGYFNYGGIHRDVTLEISDEPAARPSEGARPLAVRNGRIHVDGRPISLRGICYVYDSPRCGLVMTDEQIAADLALVRELGCNAIRCHYPMAERFYDACDRAGLLVWIEPPVYCYHPADDEKGTRFADPVWLALAQNIAHEMIAVARRHPSVAIYGIGNECNTRNPEAEAFFRALAATIRAEDSTRLLSYAALYGIVGPIADIVDVLGINSYYGWYDQIRQDGGDQCRESSAECRESANGAVARRPIDLAPMRKMLDEVLARKPNLVLFLTEFGADSVPGFRSGTRELWSEEYHADLLREIFALAREYPQIVGTFPFCFSDYRDPSKVHNGRWNEYNLKGVVTYDRQKKLAFDVVREQYATDP